MAVFTYHGGRDSKLRSTTFLIFKEHFFNLLDAFKIHDFDDDGKISKDDLTKYLTLITDFGDVDEDEVQQVLTMTTSTRKISFTQSIRQEH